MKLHYRGQLGPETVGRSMGPDNAGGLVVCTKIEYDLSADTTTVYFRPFIDATDTERLRRDRDGQWIIPGEGE